MAELTSEGYHHQQCDSSEGDSNYGEALSNNGAYYNSYNTTSDFSVSNRLLNTQEVHPKPYQQYCSNTTQQSYTYPSTYYGWLSSLPSEQGAAIGNHSNHFDPPPNRTIYQIPSGHFNAAGPTRYEHHQYPPVPPSSCSLPTHASPSPGHPCDSLQTSPSNVSWNSASYPFSTDVAGNPLSISRESQQSTKNDSSIASLVPSNTGKNSYSAGTCDSTIDKNIENTITTDREAGIEDDACSRGKNLSIVYEDDPRHECNDEDDDSDSPSNNESECEPKKPKRTRTAFTAHQLDQLELYFALSAYPDAFTRDDISRRLNIKEDRIQVWFQNRRARHRKQERTGSVSIRSRARQQRVQRLKESQVLSMYRYPPPPNRMMSPQAPSHSMSQFSFQIMTSSASSSYPLTTASSPLHPTFHYPFPVSDNFLSHPPAISAAPSNVVILNGHHSTVANTDS